MSRIGGQKPIEKTSERLERKLKGPTKVNYPKTSKAAPIGDKSKILDPYPVSGDGKVCTSGKTFSRWG